MAGIIWASIFVLRKYVGRKARVSSESGALKVLETVGLGANRLVYLLEAGDRVLVVGATPNHIALLAELDDPEVVSSLRTDADRTSPTVATLGDMMRQMGSRMGFMRPDPTKNEDGAERAARRMAQPHAGQTHAGQFPSGRAHSGRAQSGRAGAGAASAQPAGSTLLAQLRAAEQEIAESARRLRETPDAPSADATSTEAGPA